MGGWLADDLLGVYAAEKKYGTVNIQYGNPQQPTIYEPWWPWLVGHLVDYITL